MKKTTNTQKKVIDNNYPTKGKKVGDFFAGFIGTGMVGVITLTIGYLVMVLAGSVGKFIVDKILFIFLFLIIICLTAIVVSFRQRRKYIGIGIAVAMPILLGLLSVLLFLSFFV